MIDHVAAGYILQGALDRMAFIRRQLIRDQDKDEAGNE